MLHHWRVGRTAVLLTALLSACAVDPSPPAAGATPIAAAEVRLEVQSAPVAGGRVAWAQIGTGSPLVLLNGTGSPMAEWDPALLGALAGNRRVIVMDYPGLGGSTRVRGRLTFNRLADVVAEWMARIGVPQADILGWSMGTFVAQRMAVRTPERVGRLVLVGGNPGGSRTTLGPRWVQRADSDPNAGLGTYLRTNYPRNRCAQTAGRGFLRRQAAAVRSGRFPPDRVPSRTYDAMVAAEDPWLRSDGNARQLAAVAADTLVLVGREDVITPPPNSRQLVGLIPGAQLAVVRGAGHSVLFQSAVAAGAVESFLAGDLPPDARLDSGCPPGQSS